MKEPYFGWRYYSVSGQNTIWRTDGPYWTCWVLCVL